MFTQTYVDLEYETIISIWEFELIIVLKEQFSLHFAIYTIKFTEQIFFIVTTANLQSTPKGAISKREGDTTGRRSRPSTTLRIARQGREAGARRCPWIADQMATDASVSKRRWGAWTGQQRRRCGDRLAAGGSECMICGSLRQRRGCPSRCVIGGQIHTRGRW